MTTLNIPRRALPTRGDTIADAIGQIAQTFADAQLRQEFIDAKLRADQARINFETQALTQRAALANAARTAGIEQARLGRVAAKEQAELTREAALERKKTPTAAAPPTALERASQLADILKAGELIFDEKTIRAINKQIRIELEEPDGEPDEETPGEATVEPVGAPRAAGLPDSLELFGRTLPREGRDFLPTLTAPPTEIR